MKLRTLAFAAALAAFPLVGQAVPVSGQLDITANVNLVNSEFSETGNVDFTDEPGFATIATGSFESVNKPSEGATTLFTLFDTEFESPDTIYQGGGFEFIASEFFDFEDGDTPMGFKARGIIRAAGFDDTPGLFSFSTQSDEVIASFSSTTTVVPLPASVLMLMGALGGLAFIGKRRSA